MRKKYFNLSGIIILLLLFTVVLYRNAWLGDDAFITFRVVDNFINGYGLTWNPVERVQAYTHPLWLFLLSGIYLFTREIFLTSLFISIGVTLLTAIIFVFKIARTHTVALLGLGILMVSKAFIDYSSSGLENPLTHLIIVIFFYIYLKGQKDQTTLLKLSLVTSLATLNRFDTILLFLPVLIYYFLKLPKRPGLKTLLIGFLPLIGWELFSLFYYGFPFPNTAYAKLTSGIDSWSLIQQGFRYFNHLLLRSPVTALVIIFAVIFNFRIKANRYFPLVAGIILYLLYVLKVGGCFMTGRFFSAPFLMSVLILLQYCPDRSHRKQWLVVGLLIGVGIFWPRTPLWSGASYGTGSEIRDWFRGISDERAGYFQSNGLLNVHFKDDLPNTKWAALGREAAEKGDKFVYRCGVGQFGYCAGPGVFVLDGHALTDPLLSRLPMTSFKDWRIGHFLRVIPQGYEATLATGENQLYDKDLAKYYEVLSLIVRGELFSFQRLREIIKINLGIYNHYLSSYLNHPLYWLDYKQVMKPIPGGTPYNHNACRLISKGGININFGSRQQRAVFELSVDNNDRYKIIFFDDTTRIASVDILPTWLKSGGMSVDTVMVPPAAVARGYNNITIAPVKGDGAYSFGHLRFLD